MKLKNDLPEIRNVLSWLGFNLTNGRYNIKVIIFMTITLILIVNCIMDVLTNWSDLDIRVDGLKVLFAYLFFGLCLTSIVTQWNNTNCMIDMIENRFFKYPFQRTQERTNLEAQIENEMIIVNFVWNKGRPLYVASEILPPIIILLYRLFTVNIDDLSVNMLVTKHRYYYPEDHDSLTIYFIALTLQTAFYLYVVKAAYVVLSSAFISMYLIGGESRLMILSIKEMNSSIIDQDINALTNKYCVKSMNKFVKYLVDHHHHIYRSAKRVNEGIQLVALLLNFGVTLLLVTSMYVLVQRDGLIGKLPEAVYSFFIILILYFYNAIGQEVIIQDENLRTALYESQWWDKPQWYKKSFQLIMTRLTKPIQMKPAGLFVLNLQNFLTLLKGIYTFYNVLNNIKLSDV